MGPIWVLAHVDELDAQQASGDLQHRLVRGDAIVLAHLALGLNAKNFMQIDAGIATKAEPSISALTAKRLF